MDLKKFDNDIQSALQNLEMPYDASTWSVLENKLDALPAPDFLDGMMRPQLEGIDIPLDGSAWTSFANKLDIVTRVRRLRFTKIAEAAIFLLLLLNLKSFLGFVESVTHPTPAPHVFPRPIATSPFAPKIKSKSSADLAKSALSDNKTDLAQQIIDFVANRSLSIFNDPSTPDQISAFSHKLPISSNASFLDADNFYQKNGIIKFTNCPPNPAKSVRSPIADVNFYLPDSKLPKFKGPNRLYVSTYGSIDNNRLREAGHSDQSNGYSGGVSIGYRKGKWGVEAGIAYSRKTYQPKRQNVEFQNDPFNGISFFHINEVDADVVSLPVKATRRIGKIGNATAHAVAGLGAHLATSKTYGYVTTHYPPPVPVGADPNTSYTSVLPNGKGVLENGGMANNFYGTADLGLRVEHPIGKHYSAFIEPVYRHSIGGSLGPNLSRINTFSLQAGVVASL